MDLPINGYVVMEILSVVGYLVHHHREDETLSIRAVDMSDVHQNGAISPV